MKTYGVNKLKRKPKPIDKDLLEKCYTPIEKQKLIDSYTVVVKKIIHNLNKKYGESNTGRVKELQ